MSAQEADAEMPYEPYSRSPAIPQVVAHAIKTGLLDEDNDPVAFFIDLERLRSKVKSLHEAFPKNGENSITHCYAVKANPLAGVMQEMIQAGCGGECASIVEVEHCLRQGIPPNKVIFDSPCKTKPELIRCFQMGVLTNLDCMDEIEKVAAILDEMEATDPEIKDKVRIGIRINPQVGGGTIASTSTATKTSKFGTGIEDYHDAILEAYKKYEWMRGFHLHVGSQGCGVDLFVEGIRVVHSLAKEVNEYVGRKQVTILDIGGGLPMNYRGEEENPTFSQYIEAVTKVNTDLFDGTFEIFTEFGRALIQKAGWLAARVEYTKKAGGKNIATVHAGSNLMLRTCYLPSQWKHNVTVLTPEGAVKEAETELYDVAGPLCFSGDVIVHNRMLPKMVAGDHMVIHDCGGYTYGMYSRYNSRPACTVYKYEASKFPDSPEILVMKQKETLDEVLSFWG